LKKIDEIRNMISAVGKRQAEYNEFFPKYSYSFVSKLGKYMGDEDAVSLAPPTGDFDVDEIYNEEGQGIKKGKYQIGVMVKFNNLSDEGYLACRLLLSCTKNVGKLNISINDGASFQVDENDFESACEKVYEKLKVLYSSEAWFDEGNPNYQSTKIGFAG
jgi:hypothetical protein